MSTTEETQNGTGVESAVQAAERSPDPLLLVALDGTIRYANAAARLYLGERVVGRDVSTLLGAEGSVIPDLFGPSATHRSATAIRSDGEVEEVDIVIGGVIDNTTVITLRRQTDPGVSTIELLRRATHDDLTQLANRASFIERVNADTARRDPHGHALVMLDLDGFKQVNDGYGHKIGDQVLVEVARRLRQSVRPDDVVARLGGDEFALWCPGLRADATLTPFVHRLVEAIEQPIPIAAAAAAVSASVGVVLTDDDVVDTSELLARADAAMYRAKSLGPGHHVVYDEQLGRDLVRARKLERSLAGAIGDHELSLHYQAIVDMVSNDVVGAEAYVRWPHPRLGLIAPHELVEVATRTHLLTSMTNWVLRSAVAEVARWNRVLAEPLSVSVNLPSTELTTGFIETVVGALTEHQVAPSLLTVEVTEDIVAPRQIEGTRLLGELHDIGVRIAVDDFGTGRSSLHSLQELPVDVLKVDPVFIRGLATSKRQAAIVQAIVHLAHALGLEVIAEGVETVDDLEAVKEFGCDMAQGFVLAPPAPASSADWIPSRCDTALG